MSIAIDSLSQNYLSRQGGDEVIALGTFPQSQQIGVVFTDTTPGGAGASYPFLSGRPGAARTHFALGSKMFVYTPALPDSVTQGNIVFMQLQTEFPDGYVQAPPYVGEGPPPVIDPDLYPKPPTYNGLYIGSSVALAMQIVPPFFYSTSFDLRAMLPSTYAVGARNVGQVDAVGY